MMGLDSIMQFDHVIFVDGDGLVMSDCDRIYAPEVYVCLDEDDQISDDAEVDMIDNVISQGWELLSGFTGQWGYSGAIMHDSEFVGGSLERHIRDNPGYYACVLVFGLPYEEDAECEPVGWAVAYQSVD